MSSQDEDLECRSGGGLGLEYPPGVGGKNMISPQDCLQDWNSKFRQNEITHTNFRDYWKQLIPKLFSPQPSMNYQKPSEHIEEHQVQKYLFDVLERFLCDGDPHHVLEMLSSLNSPPAQCGKVFKMGEPSYSCRDCALDPTCVLCINCFKNSKHVEHRYKMNTSNGGGYCDCGDVEAWKQFPACPTHKLSPQTESVDPVSKVPLGLQLRAKLVFTSVLKYAVELLTLDTMMKLPGDLQYTCQDSIHTLDELLEEDMYCTVLYNDEVHTFDEVILTLQRTLDCEKNQAVSFVSLIDREGRCVVKCGQFQGCSEIKRNVERITGRRSGKPLMVKVVHSYVVAHQTFALRLIEWLDGILRQSEGLRAIFAKILVEQEVDPNTGRKQPSVLEDLLRSDTVLWKAARAAVHHLLITVMLMDNTSKKEFANIFTKNYASIVKDFIQDDHDHSFSITSLSVQIFTVPTLAHSLIANQDVLSVILRTFISECQKRLNSKKKLEFERNTSNSFRRANYILHDLQYLLSVPPDSFNDEIRRGFLHGYSMLLDILASMQGMDPHIRQVNQHIEFETDWENGFNLHIKLAPVITLVLSWCALDRVIYIKAMRMLLKRLQLEVDAEQCETTDLSIEGLFKANVIKYSVSSDPVSMHIPLCRLLAGMALNMERYDLGWDKLELTDCVRPTMDQIAEIAMRTLVMVSQVHAGMWRRNGQSIQHQIYFYQNPRCRGEMYDRDIQMLQLAAANTDPNRFLLQLIHKFGLENWANVSCEMNEDESLKQTTTLVEEFFSLLITIIGERYVPGMSEIQASDVIRKEVIQLLCIEPMSNSALNKALSEDVNHETGLERVIDQVANFKKPSGTVGKGVYELKEENYSEYNVFFYHYTREDQSKAENVQRARLKAANQKQVLPPPPLPALKIQYSGIWNLLQSDLMMYLLKLVVDRADNLKSKCFSEDQVHKVLHLIAIGLREHEAVKALASAGSACLPPDFEFQFVRKAEDTNLLASLEKLTSSHRIDSHKQILSWVIHQLKTALGMKQPKEDTKGEENEEADEAADAKAARAKAAAARRAKIMQQMAAQQKSFMKENSKLFDETPSGIREQKVSVSECELPDEEKYPVCLGPNRSNPATQDTSHTCILCQEEEELQPNCRTLVTAAFIQCSKVLCRVKDENTDEMEESGGSGQSSGEESPFLTVNLGPAPHTSSCGHVMHADCWKKYYDDTVEMEKRRYRSRHPASFDTDKSEFLCPLCRTLSNSVIPLIPQYDGLQVVQAHRASISSSSDSNTSVADESETKTESMKVEETETTTTMADQQTASPMADLSPSSTATSSSTEMEATNISTASESSNLDPRLVAKPGSNFHVNIKLSYCEWLEGLFVALRNRKSTEDESSGSSLDEAAGATASAVGAAASNNRGFSTCPLDQVTRELEGKHLDGRSFANLYAVPAGAELAFPKSMYEIMNLFCQTIYRMSNGEVSQDPADLIPLLVWKSCGFTLVSIVVSMMEAEKAVLGALSSRHNDCLTALVRFCGVVGSNYGDPKVIRSQSLKLLSMLLEVDTSNPSILEVDMFGLLVALTYSLPSLFNGESAAPLPSCNIQDQHILRLLYTAHITQLLLNPQQLHDLDVDFDVKETSMDCQPLLDIMHIIQESVPQTYSQEYLSDPVLVWKKIMMASLGFLRCCGLFYHYLSDVTAPSELSSSLLLPEEEFSLLQRYLALPSSPRELLESDYSLSIVKKWVNHPNIHIRFNKSEVINQSYILEVPKLKTLPDDYSELINSVSNFSCPRTVGSDARSAPSMCLVCGEILCSQSYCCQSDLEGQSVGACTAHAHTCGAGAGIFLRVRECKIVMLSGRTRGCFVPPPYLDQYGETDSGLRRGNPLRLCKERYRKLERMWVNHWIPEEVTRNLEASSGYVTNDWINL